MTRCETWAEMLSRVEKLLRKQPKHHTALFRHIESNEIDIKKFELSSNQKKLIAMSWTTTLQAKEFTVLPMRRITAFIELGGKHCLQVDTEHANWIFFVPKEVAHQVASVRNEYGKETMFYLDTLAAKQFIMQRALMRQA